MNLGYEFNIWPDASKYAVGIIVITQARLRWVELGDFYFFFFCFLITVDFLGYFFISILKKILFFLIILNKYFFYKLICCYFFFFIYKMSTFCCVLNSQYGIWPWPKFHQLYVTVCSVLCISVNSEWKKETTIRPLFMYFKKTR